MRYPDDTVRLETLQKLDLLDGRFRHSFERITRTACKLFDVPYAALAIAARDRHWFCSRIGLAMESVGGRALPGTRDSLAGDFVSVSDLLNSRHETSELARAGFRFYAAAPLTTQAGVTLGALCVLDTVPRAVSPEDIEALSDLAGLLMVQIELGHGHGRIDTSSGLPNQARFIEDLEALARTHPHERRLVTLIDLASPEQLATSVRVMGTSFVDTIALEAAGRIRSMMTPGQQAYQVAETQFACLAPPEISETQYRDRVSDQLQQMRSETRARFVTTTAVGIAPFILARHQPLDVLRMAHNAAQDARLTDCRVALYSAQQDAAHQRRFAILEAFGHALEHPEELTLAYQPRIDLATGGCCGAEAVLRWRSARLGAVSPAEFMPFIEQSGMIRAATARVLEIGLRQLAEWRAAGLTLELALNVSAMNLLEPDFAERLNRAVRQNGLDPAQVEIEMTESASIGASERMLSMLTAIADSGVRIAIDDFGTGYSGLSYLQRLPARTVKIDQSFIRDLASEAGNQAVVRATVSLGHDLGYRVVAEGVETEETLDLVAAAGCDEAQGFFFSRPLPAEAFADWFRGWTAAARRDCAISASAHNGLPDSLTAAASELPSQLPH